MDVHSELEFYEISHTFDYSEEANVKDHPVIVRNVLLNCFFVKGHDEFYSIWQHLPVFNYILFEMLKFWGSLRNPLSSFQQPLQFILIVIITGLLLV